MNILATHEEQQAQYKKLIQRYPFFGSDNDLDDKAHLFEIPYGWLHVIEDLLAHVDVVIARHENIEFIFTQLKEKFGGGRFYYSLYNKLEDEEAIDDLFDALSDVVASVVDNYEDLAGYTCQVCGAPGFTEHIKVWTYTLCKAHRSTFD